MEIGPWNRGGKIMLTERVGDDERSATLRLSGWRVIMIWRLVITIGLARP
jgi:hypothetical protein